MQDYEKEAEKMAQTIEKIINRLCKILKQYGLTAEQINEIITAITEQ